MVTTLIYTLHWHIATGPPGTLAPMSEHFVVFTFFSQVKRIACKLGLTRLGRERRWQLSTLASQSHLGKRSRKYLQLCLGPKCCYVCRSMSKKRPPGHFRGPSLKLPVPGSLSHVATSLCRDYVQIDQNQFSLIIIVRACSYPAHVHRRLLFEDLCKKNLPAVSSSLQSEELALVSVATECFQFCFLLKLAATIISIGFAGKSFLLSQELPAPLSCG